MTRQEEIQKLIDEETGIDNYGSSDYQVGVCDGDYVKCPICGEYIDWNIGIKQ